MYNYVKRRLGLLLGDRLKDIDFQSIYASPSKRTVHTATLIKGGREQLVIEDENLREIYLGEWEGQTQDALKEKYPEEYHAFWNTPHLYTTDSGESFYQLQDRVINFLKRIMADYDNGNILIVTHSVFIKLYYYIVKVYQFRNCGHHLSYMIRVYQS